jgi:hypothetical protein
MSDKKKEETEISPLNINLPKPNETIKLIGNKRERETTEEDKISKIICGCCGSENSECILSTKDSIKSEEIIELFSKESEFTKLLKENIDNAISNNNLQLNNLCNKCLLNEFIKGGIDKIFSKKKQEENIKQEKNEKNYLDINSKIKELTTIYSVNLNYAILQLMDLKSKYFLISKNINKIFENVCIQLMLSKNREPFPDLKKKIDNSVKDFQDAENQFNNLLNNLIYKEDMKTFILDGILNNEENHKNNILKILKQLEYELENNKFETPETSTDKDFNEQKKENDKQNKILSDMLLMNKNDQLKNNLLLTQNLFNNGPNLFNTGLGILPIGISPNPPNNILLSNMMLNPSLNPSILNQINNTINYSMLSNMNNNANDANKNINNGNNLPFQGLNNLPGQNPNMNAQSDIEKILIIRNLLNNNNLPTNNNLLNNLYANQINPNLITPISLNNFVPQNVPNVPFISPNLNNNNNPGQLNTNNIPLDENRKILMNREKNMVNINQSPKNIANIPNIANLNNLINNNIVNNMNEQENNNINKNLEINPNLINKENSLTNLFNNVAREKRKNGDK